MLDPKNVLSVTELKTKTSKVLEQVRKTKEPVYIMSRSKPKAVLIDLEKYNSLEEALEDLEDILAVQEARNDPTISLDEFLKKHPALADIK
ncbi:MAG: hypothetical protein A2Z24_02010 [Candidatus Woykebacteria bacterium RBG_16_44_10]|uniref:Antitoxin n=1 Tax=Candidatus Woykebacteria bacterium RBG_16_44_10 TaxID=1802597 RepID=A0A1G1WFM9_9BACT|nr:MAG: hypothetical protein A2Z24_02010 [Candidatus Woykebacteria bacterium RBG_16_44_10]